MKTLGLPVLVLLLSPVGPGVAWAADRDTVRCESDNGRPHYCRVGLGGQIRLVRQLSDTACVEGDSWGAEHGAVWVDRGCRAEFAVDHGRSRDEDTSRALRCESTGGRSNICAADTHRGVELVRQLSKSACIRGRSWGWDDAGIWVTGGCRAEFRIPQPERAESRAASTDGPAARQLRCESEGGKEKLCPAETRGGVRLLRQRSRTACIEGQTWGYDQRGVWVNGGCRGEFATGLGVASGWGSGGAD